MLGKGGRHTDDHGIPPARGFRVLLDYLATLTP